MFDDAANWLRRKFLFNLNDIIVTNENIEFRFNERKNIVEISYSIQNRTPYSFKIIGIKGNLEVFAQGFTIINHLEFKVAAVRKITGIKIEHNLNDFETRLIKDLRKEHETLNSKITVTHIIARTGDNLAFDKTIKDDKTTVVIK